MLDRLFVRRKVEEFLLEDIGYQDLTTDNLDVDKNIEAVLLAKDEGILAGVDIALEVFNILDPDIKVERYKKDGDKLQKGEQVLKLSGSGKSILKGERVFLNLVQKLSGIATTTNRYVQKVKGTSVKLLDTRKTTPGLRAFEKYAVRVGGGYNHRFALYDMVMIKDNHIALVGSISDAVRQIKQKISPMIKIEVEVSSLDEFKEALETEADIIMLDNMDINQIKEAVKMNQGRKRLEVSGNITLDNIEEYAKTGVDFISTGAVIHSSKWLDLSLKFK